jgi:hypothetical protein
VAAVPSGTNWTPRPTIPIKKIYVKMNDEENGELEIILRAVVVS